MYVDDSFVVVNNIELFWRSKSELQEKCVLQLTLEMEHAVSLDFLGTIVRILQDIFHIVVYNKETNTGDCITLKSTFPQRYKT